MRALLAGALFFNFLAGLLSTLASDVVTVPLEVKESWLGNFWKQLLESEDGNSWFHQWNKMLQPKFDQLAEIAESEGDSAEPFRVLMSGDSTMRHQYGAVCAFLGERPGSRFNSSERQNHPGCCVDTLEDGGRGLCFDFKYYRFLSATSFHSTYMDAFYIGSGLHLLHMMYAGQFLEPLRVQQWLAYEQLLEDEIATIRRVNGPDIRIAFMTSHTAVDERYTEEFAEVVEAWRGDPGNATIRAVCESQVQAAAIGPVKDYHYWESHLEMDGYTKVGEGKFTVDTYCEEGLMDRHGTLQLSGRARPVMERLGVPLVDAARIVEGQGWATDMSDGRHFAPLVPHELWALLDALTSPRPAPLFRYRRDTEEGDGDVVDDDSHSPGVESLGIEGHGENR